MNYFLLKIVFFCVGLTLLFTAQARGETEQNANNCIFNAKRLFSEQKWERAKAFEILRKNYIEVSGLLYGALRDAVEKNKEDRSYHSPLHIAILSVDAWNVLCTVETLLSIIDYELDVRSLPDGMVVSGDYFYPAASALVRLQVELIRIIGKIETAGTPKQLRLLTWVLFKRTGSAEKAISILKDVNQKEQKTRQNISEALELLKKPQDLLPPPKWERNEKAVDDIGVAARQEVNVDSPVKSPVNEENHEVRKGAGEK